MADGFPTRAGREHLQTLQQPEVQEEWPMEEDEELGEEAGGGDLEGDNEQGVRGLELKAAGQVRGLSEGGSCMCGAVLQLFFTPVLCTSPSPLVAG
jgi:hypothetical protein